MIAPRRAGQPTGRYANTDGAWKSFVENYLPEEDQATFCPDREPDKGAEANTKKPEPQFFKTVLLRVASVVLAIAIVSAAGTVTASTFGFDFWAWFTAWTQGVFGVQKPNSASSGDGQEIPEQLSELGAVMKKYGFPGHLLPTYLPEEYEAGEMICEANSGYVNLYCLLKTDDNSILFDYTLHLTNQPAVITQKDENNSDVYEIGSVDHCIMTKLGTSVYAAQPADPQSNSYIAKTTIAPAAVGNGVIEFNCGITATGSMDKVGIMLIEIYKPGEIYGERHNYTESGYKYLMGYSSGKHNATFSFQGDVRESYYAVVNFYAGKGNHGGGFQMESFVIVAK